MMEQTIFYAPNLIGRKALFVPLIYYF